MQRTAFRVISSVRLGGIRNTGFKCGLAVCHPEKSIFHSASDHSAEYTYSMIDKTQVFQNVLMRLSDLEKERTEAKLKAKRTKDEINMFKFKGELYCWVRDIVVNKAPTDSPLAGTLRLIDPKGTSRIERYLPSAVNYVVMGPGKVWHAYREDLIHNFTIAEEYIHRTVDLNLRSLLQGIHICSNHLHYSFPSRTTAIYTREGLSQLSLFLDRNEAEDTLSKAAAAGTTEKREMEVMVQLLKKLHTAGQEECDFHLMEFKEKSRRNRW